ncbi:MAG: hypothetical protein K9N09_10395 [Candidatus Cloacimonetes bacterium]|nr:hypothetical protein [Candidatus Cloacimonadota bacterium]MCF7814588.1 hypothetical protein [Candidatus Cloacimonadota bacterium]MCF7869101.1 hypothetical protein [Candidatus Cloacimonadota bacterium]MCF7884518.1 hypothetical protein [Candidatus Cloacimonadota bacterium]
MKNTFFSFLLLIFLLLSLSQLKSIPDLPYSTISYSEIQGIDYEINTIVIEGEVYEIVEIDGVKYIIIKE